MHKLSKKLNAAGLSAVLAVTSTGIMPTAAADTASYDMAVTVDLSAERKAISPYIYGVNEYSNENNLKNVNASSVRQGGNRYTAYNWETNYSNAGSDWKHSSDTNIGDITDGPAYAAQKLSEEAGKYSIPFKLATVQMCGYVSADKNGEVTEAESAPSDRWYTVQASKGSSFDAEPDLTDDTVYIDEYVNYVVNKIGGAKSDTGIQAWSLDNEPVLWASTHSRIHPDYVTNDELISKSIATAKAVKSVDPDAQIFGPAFWGMLPCIQLATNGNYTSQEWEAVKSDYSWYMDYYLEQMKQAEEESGQRLLDVFDVHYYSQGVSSDEDVLQAARSLYDPDYVENSWLQPWCGGYFPFLTRMQESIEKYYPGTKLAVSEYNIANLTSSTISRSSISAIAEAEALGAFAMNEVYFATYWGSVGDNPYVASAMNLYTNYDGNGSAFGDTYVTAKTEDLSKAAAFASIDGDDTSTVKMTLSNKDTEKTENAEITINGGSNEYKSAVVYAITPDSTDIKIIDIQNDVSGKTINVELPALSVAQIVISDKETDVTIPVEPVIRTEKTVYSFDELELSENGFPMLPLGDKDHLKQIIINSTVNSTMGSSYGGGGGGICFNKVVPEGETAAVWGSKSFGYSLGTADSIVDYDGTFTIVADAATNKTAEVNGVSNDEYAEIQAFWWKYSEKDSDGADLDVTINSITLVYEYDDSEPIVTTTTTPVDTTTTTTSTQPTTVAGVTYGDANGDGDVTVADATLIMQAAANPDVYKIDEKNKLAADCAGNGDGITSSDALAIQRLLSGVIDSLPIA